MRIYGLDFTSAPGARKPITLACAEIEDTHLRVQTFVSLPTFAAFEAFLHSDGPWIAALDFPFGLPRKLLVNLGWPLTWEGYMQHIASLGKEGFEQALTAYRTGRPAGDKYHLRATDARASARSPMMLHRVPVGKMFFQGASRLLNSPVSILPCRPTSANRIVLEGYPALVARTFIGKRPYKSDERHKQTGDKKVARQAIIDGLCSPALRATYGLTLQLSAEMSKMLVADALGDYLDALLCAVQAGWAFLRRGEEYGVPETCDEVEGWIVDAHF